MIEDPEEKGYYAQVLDIPKGHLKEARDILKERYIHNKDGTYR